jgi:hypothetical protein
VGIPSDKTNVVACAILGKTVPDLLKIDERVAIIRALN